MGNEHFFCPSTLCVSSLSKRNGIIASGLETGALRLREVEMLVHVTQLVISKARTQNKDCWMPGPSTHLSSMKPTQFSCPVP